MLSLFLALALSSDHVSKSPDSKLCEFKQVDKDANAKLSFEEFDQDFDNPKNWRGLGITGCMEQALEASQDYVARGPVLEPYHQRIMLFHYGQTLALLGRETEAAPFISFSREPKGSRPPEIKLNWNDYVAGTWAFLKQDRALLIAMRDSVLKSPGAGNETNGNVLVRLEKCFGKPYSIAYSITENCDEK
jgi:hypothetical protein